MIKRTIIAFLLAAPLILLVACRYEDEWAYSVPPVTGDGWVTASLSDVGMDTEPLKKMMNQYLNTDHHVHSILIVKDGKLVFEEYFGGFDFGGDASNGYQGPWVDFNRDIPHCLHSATKSFTSALAGIAIDKKFIPDVKEKMFDYFNDYAYLYDGEKGKITLEHLLVNTSGLDWIDGVGPDTDLIQLWQEPDPIKFMLDRPVIHPPGTWYNYSGANTNLAGEIVRRASGLDAVEFSGIHLFEPLGVKNYRWLYLQNQVVYCSGDLFITPRAMAKFGYLFLNQGVWKNERIISRNWITGSVYPHTRQAKSRVGSDPADAYGYAWWIYDYELEDGRRVSSYSARGWGGQYITVLPGLKTVVIFTQGYYTTSHAGLNLMNKYILPSLTAGR